MGLRHTIASHPAVQRAADIADHHRLTVMLTLAAGGALVLTAVSLSMYYSNGFYRYDLSRPGYEKERSELAKPESKKVYDTTSPVTKGTIDLFLKEFDERNHNLRAYGDFRDESLGDDDLLILPPAQ